MNRKAVVDMERGRGEKHCSWEKIRKTENKGGHDIDTEIDQDKPGKQTLQSRTEQNR